MKKMKKMKKMRKKMQTILKKIIMKKVKEKI